MHRKRFSILKRWFISVDHQFNFPIDEPSSWLLLTCPDNRFIKSVILYSTEAENLLYLDRISNLKNKWWDKKSLIFERKWFFCDRNVMVTTNTIAETYWGISHWLSSGLGSDSEPSPSRATSVNTLQLGSEIPSLHSKSEPNLVHTGGSGQAQLRLSSEISEPSPEPSQCEMPHHVLVL